MAYLKVKNSTNFAGEGGEEKSLETA